MDTQNENSCKPVILYIAEILIHSSNETNPLSQQNILEILKSKYNVTVNRKTVGKNLVRMKETGWPVACREVIRTMNGKEVPLTLDWYWRHHLSQEDIKSLSDMLYFSHNSPVQIKKILSKIKEMHFNLEKEDKAHIRNISNTNCSYLDTSKIIRIIDEAITNRKKVSFCYMHYDVDGKFKAKKNVEGVNKCYRVSPYIIVASDGKYYLLANEDGKDSIEFFVIDRITEIKVSKDDARVQKTINELKNGIKLNELIGVYPEVYTGHEELCVCDIKPEYLTETIEFFGKSLHVTEISQNKIRVEIKAFPDAVHGWAMRNASFVHVISPASLVKKMREDAAELIHLYGGV